MDIVNNTILNDFKEVLKEYKELAMILGELELQKMTFTEKVEKISVRINDLKKILFDLYSIDFKNIGLDLDTGKIIKLKETEKKEDDNI